MLDIFGKGMGYTGPLDIISKTLRDILGKSIGYIGQKLWDKLWDIFVKSYGIYLTKLRGILGKTLGYIMR